MSWDDSGWVLTDIVISCVSTLCLGSTGSQLQLQWVMAIWFLAVIGHLNFRCNDQALVYITVCATAVTWQFNRYPKVCCILSCWAWRGSNPDLLISLELCHWAISPPLMQQLESLMKLYGVVQSRLMKEGGRETHNLSTFSRNNTNN